MTRILRPPNDSYCQHPACVHRWNEAIRASLSVKPLVDLVGWLARKDSTEFAREVCLIERGV